MCPFVLFQCLVLSNTLYLHFSQKQLKNAILHVTNTDSTFGNALIVNLRLILMFKFVFNNFVRFIWHWTCEVSQPMSIVKNVRCFSLMLVLKKSQCIKTKTTPPKLTSTSEVETTDLFNNELWLDVLPSLYQMIWPCFNLSRDVYSNGIF